jgi:1-acyl-sn-glycerol-3-phosphate acyltransferase
MHEFFRWLALITGWPLQLLIFKRKTYYENKAKQSRFIRGGALIISNHYSVFDYMVNLFLFPFRKLYVVYWSQAGMRTEKKIRFGMKFFGGIPSDREAMSMRFIDESVKLLERGKLVQIYPEAHITDDGEMHPFKPSYLIIALRAGVPIIPVITDGNYGLFRRVHLIIGEPIEISEDEISEDPTREELVALSDRVYEKCLALQRQLRANIENDKQKGKRKVKKDE